MIVPAVPEDRDGEPADLERRVCRHEPEARRERPGDPRGQRHESGRVRDRGERGQERRQSEDDAARAPHVVEPPVDDATQVARG